MDHVEIRKRLGQATLQSRNHTAAIQSLTQVCEWLLDEIERLELEKEDKDYGGDL